MNLKYKTIGSAVKRIAASLEDEGYVVRILPDAKFIPIELHGYQPDIMATKGDERIFVEVRSKNSVRNTAPSKQAAKVVAAHPGWKFMVQSVEIENPDETTDPLRKVELEEIAHSLDTVAKIINSAVPEAATIYLWNIIISLLSRGSEKSETDERFSDKSIINFAYTSGVISFAEQQKLLSWLAIRNRFVHSLGDIVPMSVLIEMNQFALRLFDASVGKQNKDQTGNLL